MADKKKYFCEKCGSENLRVLQAGKRTGIYCNACGAWVKWLTNRSEVSDVYSSLISNKEIRGKAIKKVVKYGGVNSIRCEKCNCLLYSSDGGKPLGQFDLLNASFCPQCGAEFVDVQKKFEK